MLQHLRDGQHQPCGGGLLRQQRAIVDGDGFNFGERGVDLRKQPAPPGRVVRRGRDAEPLAQRVVQLGRVQPHMGMRERQPMRRKARPLHRQRLARRGIGGRGDGGGEQVQQGRGRRQGGVLPADHGLGEALHGLRRRSRRRGLDLRGDGRFRGAGARDDRRRAIAERREPLDQPGQLQPLHAQPQPQRVLPADIRPPVRVVADPGGHDDRRGLQREGAFPPDRLPGLDQRGGERIERVPPACDGDGGLVEFRLQRRRGRTMREPFGQRRAAGGGGERGTGLRRQGEGRMRGEDRGEARPLDGLAIGGEGHRAVVGIGAHEACRDRGQRRSLVAEPGIGGKPRRTVRGRVARQARDQRGEVVRRDAPLIHRPADVECHEQDRVAEGVGGGRFTRGAQAGEQVGGHGGIVHPLMLHLRRDGKRVGNATPSGRRPRHGRAARRGLAPDRRNERP